MCTGVCFFLQTVGQKFTPPSAVGVIMTLESVFGTALSIALGQEMMTFSIGLGFVGCFQAYNYTTFLPKESCAQGIIFDRKNKEVYYPVNGYITCTSAGVIENAISGTQLKEAVQRATQKTYWHSVKIKGANGIFTFNAPSTLNTPVVSTEKLLELFNNNTWEGCGKLGTDMLFAIRLLNDNIEFIKADDTSVSIGTFGTLDISDNVKEDK